MEEISEFQGEYRWLSNFWPCTVMLGNLEFKSVEFAYVAAKSNDLDVRREVQLLSTPGEAKRFGRTIKLRPDWEEVKIEVMYKLLQQKFAPGTLLAFKLVSTGNANLVEGNKWGDVFWGVCKGKGQNNDS